MSNVTRQVQDANEWLAKVVAELENRKHPFRQDRQANRRYPAEAEGKYLAEFLNSSAAAKRSLLLESLRVIQDLAQASRNHDLPAVDRLRTTKRGLKFAYGYLVKTAMPRASLKQWALDVHEDGLIVHPATAEAKAALAVLVLEKKWRIERITRCLHCQAWFYARFKHQRFCPDPVKKCQWSHYHSSEWRKQNRERNKKHQRAYRVRNPARSKYNPAG
jgi:hypothetical protein